MWVPASVLKVPTPAIEQPVITYCVMLMVRFSVFETSGLPVPVVPVPVALTTTVLEPTDATPEPEELPPQATKLDAPINKARSKLNCNHPFLVNRLRLMQRNNPAKAPGSKKIAVVWICP
jgi:hypothetical protein